MRRMSLGFTLLEMLIVVLVIVLMLGFVIASPTADQRDEAVRGAAEELASVLRETRSRAIRKNTPYAIAFNIQNAPGSTGRILNNRSGGHWYRLIGPRDSLLGDNGNAIAEHTWHSLPLIDMTLSALNGRPVEGLDKPVPPIEHYFSLVSRSWIDEPHVLSKGKVRFLALTDQDNGDNAAPAAGGYYTATYPRPWFGWWDATTGQMHPWGGYDPTLKGESQKFQGYNNRQHAQQKIGGRIASISGFYYEGLEGEIIGCVNPCDRKVLQDDVDKAATDIYGIYGGGDLASKKLYTIAVAGEPRPLINAQWLDYVICFRPDGTVVDDWFRLRQGYAKTCKARTDPDVSPYVPSFPTYDLRDAGPGDRCNNAAYLDNWDDYRTPYVDSSDAQREATTYAARTGYYWITLAPDAANDSPVFASAEQALRSLTPMYRVGVSMDGQVKVIRVRNTNKEALTFDATITGTDWQNKNKIWGKADTTWSATTAITQPNYVNHELRNSNGTPRGLPIHDTVLPEMLRDRKWWWKAP